MGGTTSGRKSNYDNLKIEDLMNKSFGVVLRFINDEKQPIMKRAELASRFALKYIPEKQLIQAQVHNLHTLDVDSMRGLIEDLSQVLSLQRDRDETRAISHDSTPTSDNKSDCGGGGVVEDEKGPP